MQTYYGQLDKHFIQLHYETELRCCIQLTVDGSTQEWRGSASTVAFELAEVLGIERASEFFHDWSFSPNSGLFDCARGEYMKMTPDGGEIDGYTVLRECMNAELLQGPDMRLYVSELTRGSYRVERDFPMLTTWGQWCRTPYDAA